jgi:hypothetical protein
MQIGRVADAVSLTHVSHADTERQNAVVSSRDADTVQTSRYPVFMPMANETESRSELPSPA